MNLQQKRTRVIGAVWMNSEAAEQPGQSQRHMFTMIRTCSCQISAKPTAHFDSSI